LSSGGHGRAILAFSPPDVIERVKELVGDPDAVGSLESALVEIREKGYALSSNEIRPGVTGLAVPTVDRDGYAIGSIGLVTLAGHFPDVDDVASSLMSVAADISKHRVTHG
jgi:DNA-binding IclR family transcriptional regulator